MEKDVYVDILFLINFSMDYLCLYICAKVLSRRLRLWRSVSAAALGGVYSVLSLFLDFPSPINILVDCGICLIMCLITFFEKGRTWGSLLVTAFLFIGISMMTGGCMTAVFNLLNKLDLPLDSIESDGISTYLFALLALIAGVISLKSGQVISKKGSVKECRLLVRFCGEDFEFSGFSDSGNLVRDPISGKAIIFLERSVLEKKLPLDFLDRYAKGEMSADSPCKSLRLIALRTASGSSLAVAALPESVMIEYVDSNKRERSIELDALISPTDIGKSAAGYNAIIPSEIIKE
ncbi:MAG: sigma-E processing peptidase SpoIIGA [Clostridia bacterium]|nr:sigma-E processing peptidase SpoIIGA [Clostridia bacterium]